MTNFIVKISESAFQLLENDPQPTLYDDSYKL